MSLSVLDEHREVDPEGYGADRIAAEIGTPVLAVTCPDGAQHAAVGPVLPRLPAPDDALRLWQGTVLLAPVPGFPDLKA